MLVIGMMAGAQTTKNQITTKPLQLNSVPIGLATDSHLVIGADKVVKQVTAQIVDGSETIIQGGANVSISGKGSIKAPYIVTSSIIGSYNEGEFKMYSTFRGGSVENTISGWGSSIELAGSQRTELKLGGLRFWDLTSTSFRNQTIYSGNSIDRYINNDGVLGLPASFTIKLPTKGGVMPMSVNNVSSDNMSNITLSTINTTFTTNDGKIVTVTKGVITNIQDIPN
jgi:hypothetical protein